MAVSFQVDGSDMPLDPEWVEPQPIDIVGRKHSLAPIVNAIRTFRLSWDAMSLTDFATLSAKCTTASHTAKIPHPDSGTYTTFATAYLRLARFHFEDINAYNIEVEISGVTLP